MTMNETAADLMDVWRCGYSVAELWGYSAPVSRGGPALHRPHIIMWGILGIVDYQVDRGAGHRYLRDRLWHREWIAVGYAEPRNAASRLQVVPTIDEAKFGRKQSAVGDGITNYVDVRIVHARLFATLSGKRKKT